MVLKINIASMLPLEQVDGSNILKNKQAKYLAGIDISQKSIDKFSHVCDKVQKQTLKSKSLTLVQILLI